MRGALSQNSGPFCIFSFSQRHTRKRNRHIKHRHSQISSTVQAEQMPDEPQQPLREAMAALPAAPPSEIEK
jgi:hypothetical protein